MVFHYFVVIKQRCASSNKDPRFTEFVERLKMELSLEYVCLVRQVHGINGVVISDIRELSEPVSFLKPEADFIITNQPGVGIAISTADCLPLTFYDPKKRVIGIAHVGWRGSIANISSILLARMTQEYETEPCDVIVYLGPGARPCCYEVQKDFIHRPDVENCIKKHPAIIETKKDKYCFDNSELTVYNLKQEGILSANIHTEYNFCTICNDRFHSYRRYQKQGLYKSQETIIWLS